MNQWRHVVMATLLASLCFESTSMDLARKRVEDFTSEWSRGGPLKWLQTLRENPRAVFYVNRAPENWISERDLEVLVAEMESDTPAATVCYLASAHAVPDDHQSTVGHEAAILVDAFRRKWHYPGNCSDLSGVDPSELRQWWLRRNK